jgi:hypothetical protein
MICEKHKNPKPINKQPKPIIFMRIHQPSFTCPVRIASVGAWLAVSGLLLMSGSGTAQIVTLNDKGSSATIDLASAAGMYNWTVLGQNQLNQQWFWYRTDDGFARPINSIGGLAYQTFSGDDGINHVKAIYQNSQLTVAIDYILTGGGAGSGNADIMESIVATNHTGSSLNLNFYEYSNFNLLQSGNNTVEIMGAGPYFYVTQTSGSTAIQEGIVSPFADYAEAGYYNSTLNKLNTETNLFLNGNTLASSGNVTWAFQWDQTIDANGGGLEIFKDKSLSIAQVPEPGTTALVVLGGLCLAGRMFRRRFLA